MYTTNQITISKHANFERMQQRGVQPELIPLWMAYGICQHQHNGCIRWCINKSAIERMLRDGVSKQLILLAEKKRNLCVVTNTEENFVKTVVQEHRQRRSYRCKSSKHQANKVYH